MDLPDDISHSIGLGDSPCGSFPSFFSPSRFSHCYGQFDAKPPQITHSFGTENLENGRCLI